MPDLQDLKGIVILLVLTGMLLGVGILALHEFGEAVEELTTVTNETLAISSGTGTVAHPDIKTFIELSNTTNSTDTTGSTLLIDVNITGAGVVTVNTDLWGDANYNASYTYMRDTAATDATEQVNAAVGEIPQTWLPLIVTVLMLSIVLIIVITSFGGTRR